VQRVHEPQFRAHARGRRAPRRVRGCAPIPVSSFNSNMLCAISPNLALKRKRFHAASLTNGVIVNTHDKCRRSGGPLGRVLVGRFTLPSATNSSDRTISLLPRASSDKIGRA
jgi:hypothetical protein